MAKTAFTLNVYCLLIQTEECHFRKKPEGNKCTLTEKSYSSTISLGKHFQERFYESSSSTHIGPMMRQMHIQRQAIILTCLAQLERWDRCFYMHIGLPYSPMQTQCTWICHSFINYTYIPHHNNCYGLPSQLEHDKAALTFPSLVWCLQQNVFKHIKRLTFSVVWNWDDACPFLQPWKSVQVHFMDKLCSDPRAMFEYKSAGPNIYNHLATPSLPKAKRVMYIVLHSISQEGKSNQCDCKEQVIYCF